ncbi:MAG: TraC family protein [Chloroflexota bacterium]|nr:TraC family protein [Chloroflexota bacterium]
MTSGSVQASRLGLARITEAVVELADGEHRAVLEVSGGVARLDDADRQHEAVLAGFAALLNALTFPVQIVVRSTPVDLMRYVAALEDQARQALPAALSALARDHAAFVQRLARQRMLLERRFYVVVPAEPARRTRWSQVLPTRRGASDAAGTQAAHAQLALRCDELAGQLARCGLHARRLGDVELAELLLACWSPERARAQRFRQQLQDYSTLVVRIGQAAPGVD